MTSSGKNYEIDLEGLLRSRFPGIPDYAVKAAGKIFHMDFLNTFFRRGYEGVEFCTECLKYLDVKVEVEGLEKLRPDGRYTLASNHPLGGIDGVAECEVFGRFFGGKIRFMVNDFLMSIKGLAPLMVPVNKIGAQSRELSALTAEAFSSSDQVIIFPSGKCSRKIGGVIQDPEWKKTFITKSVSSGREIVPVRFFGRNSGRFYFVDEACKALGIKANLSMGLLPDELYRGRGKTYRMVIGDPIPPSVFDSSKSPLQWAAWVREKAYSLK
ncbi:MAG: 1-acyl-sn-glycerol-3-phosphate acyltransferase [Bacteroidales bacterium]|nr:1-acyl-sn-glycerol-3-phosphate acyltransferase [Bacteroidales bacterium]